MSSLLLVITLLIAPSLQDIRDNQIDPLEEAKNDILNEQMLKNVGSVLSNFMNSDGAKQLGNILSSASNSEKTGDLLQGLEGMLGQGGAQGFDPSMLGAFMDMFQGSGGAKQNDDGFSMDALMSIFGGLFGQTGAGGKQDMWSYLPMFLQTANAFLGPEARKREKKHESHAGLIPPFLEKLHLMYDHFINSDLATRILNTLGAEKFIKVFADENGRFSYQRFVELLENHSFRKHWISMVTKKIASVIAKLSDVEEHKKYLTTFQHFLNGLLKRMGYPKGALFDPQRPVETITALVNHFTKQTLNIKFDSNSYVTSLVVYVQDVFRLAEKRGILGVDSGQLSNKLADTINLEVIEPIAKVNRAYRFATKVHKCDRYVMCLANQQPEIKDASLPGLTTLLSKGTSLVFSWFLSSDTKTAYFVLYDAIMEGSNCKKYYKELCHDFHLEEIKVKEEYVHSEL